MPQHLTEKRREFTTRRDLLKSALRLTGAGLLSSALLTKAGLADAEVDAVTVQILSGDISVGAFLAKPRTGGSSPAVIVIHDALGLNDQIRNTARRFAAAGFVSLAPDLLSRAGGVTKTQTAEDAIHQLSVDGTVQDLSASFSYLKDQPGVAPGQTSCVGFGWGGWRSLMLAANIEQIHRTVFFYSSVPDYELTEVNSPVLAHYAQFDFRNTGNALWTAKRMKDLGKQFTYFVYPKVNYGFFDESSPDYNADATRLAWTRTLNFLKSAS
jgi:carboxymethylenebutenolidase